MKFSAAIDLAPARAIALARIDVIFTTRSANGASLSVIHAAKSAEAERIAAGAAPNAAIVAEAATRGITIAELCAMITSRAQITHEAVLTLEGERQAAKAAVASAVDQHALLAVVAALEGPNR